MQARPMDSGPAHRRLGFVQEVRIALAEDFRVSSSPGSRTTVAIWRVGALLHGRRGLAVPILRLVIQIADTVWTRGFIRAELPPDVSPGLGLRVTGAGRGIVIHPSCRIGARVTLGHHTTVDVGGGSQGPTLGDDVAVGARSVILGKIRLADGTRVSPGSVVLHDTEFGGSYAGNPAGHVADYGLP